MANETVLLKRWQQMLRKPLPKCHGGDGALDWTSVLDRDDLKGRCLNFIHDDVLPPGSSIGLHPHAQDEEYYYIVSGSGTMQLNGESFEVVAGDIAAVFPGGRHALRNTGRDDLRIVVISASDRKRGELTPMMRGIRRQSAIRIMGLPLYHIALGPAPEAGEMRGHARGIVAIGDIATGVLAMGGVARGFLALGGCAVGIVALGGAAIGGLAVGGAAVGIVAIGGAAVGYYACGGGAFGAHILSGTRPGSRDA